ncbi:hypothetical protein HELRODRAFT_179462 [Helobdella robusta]|uniref:Uncharacterized protein n=1 Tax=Helobdella robusta TaxID=6412 RepID=T1FER2_HELRO|nr:hypothetical protein HELRODRAFT_179462 [Helobdella robusta]ESN95393.1 hypothetical protein HELRODRAFT_179462 [Helobdella robusta]
MNFENRWVLRSALNFASDGEIVREVGREFQRKGPEKAKADLAKECLTRVKKKREEEDDRKPGRLGTTFLRMARLHHVRLLDAVGVVFMVIVGYTRCNNTAIYCTRTSVQTFTLASYKQRQIFKCGHTDMETYTDGQTHTNVCTCTKTNEDLFEKTLPGVESFNQLDEKCTIWPMCST